MHQRESSLLAVGRHLSDTSPREEAWMNIVSAGRRLADILESNKGYLSFSLAYHKRGPASQSPGFRSESDLGNMLP
jgi:hypothetical protein